MKKSFWILFFLITSIASAQWGTSSIKLGYFNPSATDGGFIVGFDAGKFIDRNFRWSVSFDWFHKNYVDKRLVAELDDYYTGTIGTLNELRATTNIHDFPVMLNVIAKFPVNRRTQFYLTGGIGAEVLLINYRNFLNPEEDEFEAAFDFNWRLGLGASLAVGPRSEIFSEITYHNSNPGSQYEVEDSGIYPARVFERSYDMSGLMVRIGFRFFY